jgi:hypothetical protein
MKKLTELEQLAVDTHNNLRHIELGDTARVLDTLNRIGKELSQPQKKVIDMSPMIRSGLLCSFSDPSIVSNNCISQLKGFYGLYVTGDEKARKICTPLLNHWYASDNGWNKCPIPEGFEIYYRNHDDSEAYYSDDSDRWGDEVWSNIIMFKIIRKLDDYIYPWEQK